MCVLGPFSAACIRMLILAHSCAACALKLLQAPVQALQSQA